MEDKKFVLVDGEVYFRGMTGIGPSTTRDISEAEVFDSKEAAMQSPAYSFSLMFFEPKEV